MGRDKELDSKDVFQEIKIRVKKKRRKKKKVEV